MKLKLLVCIMGDQAGRVQHQTAVTFAEASAVRGTKQSTTFESK